MLTTIRSRRGALSGLSRCALSVCGNGGNFHRPVADPPEALNRNTLLLSQHQIIIPRDFNYLIGEWEEANWKGSAGWPIYSLLTLRKRR